MPEIQPSNNYEKKSAGLRLKAGVLLTGAALAMSAKLKPAIADELAPAIQKPEFIIGAMEDSAVSENYNQSEIVASKIAEMGFNTLKISMPWTHPRQCAEIDNDLARFQNAATAAKNNGLFLMLNLIPGGGNGLGMAPTTPSQRRCFKDTLISYMHAFEQVSPGGHIFLELPNEPNSENFWRPQKDKDGQWIAPKAVVKLLAESYEPIKNEAAALGIKATVVGIGLASKDHPQQFIQEAGIAKKQVGKGRLMDAFSHHPYGLANDEAPEIVHATGGIGFGDLDRLTKTLDKSLGNGLPVVLSEYGTKTEVPPDELDQYDIFPNGPRALISEAQQAAYYSKAIKIARCHPRVGAIILFNVIDDKDGHWTSGTFYPDMTTKSSYSLIKQAIIWSKAPNPVC